MLRLRLYHKTVAEFDLFCYNVFMNLDELKERLSYLKFWLGIVVATFLAIVGWVITNYSKTDFYLIICAIITAFILLCAIAILHKLITKKFEELSKF